MKVSLSIDEGIYEWGNVSYGKVKVLKCYILEDMRHYFLIVHIFIFNNLNNNNNFKYLII